MNYTKQLMGIGSVLGLGFGAMTMWKSAIFYGKRKISLFASKRKTTLEFVIHHCQLLFLCVFQWSRVIVLSSSISSRECRKI